MHVPTIFYRHISPLKSTELIVVDVSHFPDLIRRTGDVGQQQTNLFLNFVVDRELRISMNQWRSAGSSRQRIASKVRLRGDHLLPHDVKY